MDSNQNIFYPDVKPKGYYERHRKEMLSYVPSDVTKVLEIGCGAGAFGNILKENREIEVWGVECCKVAAEKAMSRLDKVIIGDIEDGSISLPNGYFDCIIFNDVLEHLKYPWAVLRKLRDNIMDGGYIVASIPNVRYYENMKSLFLQKDWKYVDEGILDKTHLRFFTINSIHVLFQSSGYNLLNIAGINAAVFPWKLGLLNLILLKVLDDMRFLEFACVVKKK